MPLLFVRRAALLVLGGVLLAMPASALIERRVEKRFSVSEVADESNSGGSIKLTTFSGSVRVKEDVAVKEITVVVIQQSDVEKEADMDRLLEPLELKINGRAGAVSVSAHYNRTVGWSWNNWAPIRLSYEVIVPPNCVVDLTTNEGNILTSALKGRVTLNTDAGDIFTGAIDGPLTVHSISGEVSITSCSAELNASTATGNLTVGRALGRTHLSSRGGYIEVQRAIGEIVLRGDGSYAKVGFATPIKNSADISVSGGELVLAMTTDSACSLDLRSSVFGKVNVRGGLPVVVTGGGFGRSRLAGSINGGGPLIQARASGGSVMVRGLEPLPTVAVDNPNNLSQL